MRERRLLPAAAVLVALVAVIYGQAVRHDFINYDDDVYVYANDLVRHGFTRQGIVGAFGFAAGNWHPLTWLSHMLDVELFGLRAGGHHAVNAALHAANAVLVLGVLNAATGSFWRSALVAALFAVHPLRVESVAWAAERKDVLSALFWLLATGAYVRFVRRRAAGWYLAALGLFALGLTAKPMPVTLPFALLLLDVWPLGRVPADRGGGSGRGLRLREIVLEKTPLLLLSALSVAVTVQAQTRGIIPFVRLDFPARAANAAVSWVSYLWTSLWPRNLALLYPFPPGGTAPATAAAAAVLLLALTGAALLLGRRLPFLATGWFWYLGTLVPVIGLVQVGAQCRADRYTYLPIVGFTIALVWLVAAVWPRGTAARRAAAVLATCWVGALTAAAAVQTARWRDSLTLLDHTVRVTEENYLILNNLGEAQAAAGRVDQAIATFREAVRIAPEHCNASYNLGFYLLQQKKPLEALAPLERSLGCYRDQGMRLDWITDALANIAKAQMQLGRYAEAERRVQDLLRLDQRNAWGRAMLPYIRSRVP